MIAKASVLFVRISPRKVRYVIDCIRRKSVPEAHAVLNGSPRRAADILRKLLNQAVNSAERQADAKAGQLVISSVFADGGPSMRRFRAASMGRASLIKKRTSHIHLELDWAKGAKKGPQSRTPAAAAEPKKPSAAMPLRKRAAAAAKKLVGAK